MTEHIWNRDDTHEPEPEWCEWCGQYGHSGINCTAPDDHLDDMGD